MLGSTIYHIIRISTTLLRESWALYPRRTLAALAVVVLIFGGVAYAKDANKAPASVPATNITAPITVDCPAGYQSVYGSGTCVPMGIQKPSWDCPEGAHVEYFPATDGEGSVPSCVSD